MVNSTQPQPGRGCSGLRLAGATVLLTVSFVLVLTAAGSHCPKEATSQHSGSVLISLYRLIKKLDKSLDVVQAGTCSQDAPKHTPIIP